MTTDNVIAGIQLLQKYRDKSGHDLGAEHDVIYAYPTPYRLSDEDLELMIQYGWHQDVEYAGEDFAPCDYAPDESWMCYV